MLPSGKKSIYQSDIVAYCAEGGTGDGWVQFSLATRTLSLSKNKTDKYATLAVAGDEVERRFLTMENPQIAALFESLAADTNYWLRATGSREAAVVDVYDGTTTRSSVDFASAAPPAPRNGGPAAATPAVQPPRAPAATNGHRAPAAALQHVDERPQAVLAQYSECFLASLEIIRRGVEKVPELAGASPDAMLAATKEISATLFIEWNRSAGTRPLRTTTREPGEEG